MPRTKQPRRKIIAAPCSLPPARGFLAQVLIEGLPVRPTCRPSQWGAQHCRLPGSARSEQFDPSITPWAIAPLDTVCDGITRICTFVKPVQSGGSAAGEVGLCYVLATQTSGNVQFNWQDDNKAEERWIKRVEPILKACKPVMDRAPDPKGPDRHKWRKCLIKFPHCAFQMQGVLETSQHDNLDSDAIRFQFNEELHKWARGRLGKAYRRTTAFWNSFVMNISNAGEIGDDLHQAMEEGTQEYWEGKCPGCGLYHAPVTRWDDKQPELGGLRYDSESCKRGKFEYDYNRLESTIRLQLPCGFEVREEPLVRGQLSLSGRYGAPRNPNAHRSNRSFTLEAVSVDYIPFMTLIVEKHQALKALAYGDPVPWKKYLQERECRFWDPQNRPLTGRVEVSTSIRKSRDGLRAHPGFFARYFSLDRQRGNKHKGELKHWWLVIRDVAIEADGTIRAALVYEGKVETDENAIHILDEHQCLHRLGVADSGWDTEHVYDFCLRYGINAIKGGKSELYAHKDKSLKIFSPEQALHTLIEGRPPNFDYVRVGKDKFEPQPDEPRFWQYSKQGIRDRLAWMRSTGSAVQWEIPADVSEAYKQHMEAEDLETLRVGRAREELDVWVQHSDRNDLFVCECYIAMLMEKAGLVGAGVMKK